MSTKPKTTLFRKKILAYYTAHKRAMPWRETSDPYSIWISEIMLQQTQVDRVREKYEEFLKEFPTIQDLAAASVSEVLTVWKGLGYNRRALQVKKSAELIAKEYQGVFPSTLEALDELPGIGQATAAAILAYAYNQPHVFIETNIRTVFIDHFFKEEILKNPDRKISDTELLPLIEAALDRKNPREWYYALMDYGSMLKRTRVNPSRASKHHVKQSKFEGSDRQLRGQIIELYLKTTQLKNPTNKKNFSLHDVHNAFTKQKQRTEKIFNDLKSEGFFT